MMRNRRCWLCQQCVVVGVTVREAFGIEWRQVRRRGGWKGQSSIRCLSRTCWRANMIVVTVACTCILHLQDLCMKRQVLKVTGSRRIQYHIRYVPEWMAYMGWSREKSPCEEAYPRTPERAGTPCRVRTSMPWTPPPCTSTRRCPWSWHKNRVCQYVAAEVCACHPSSRRDAVSIGFQTIEFARSSVRVDQMAMPPYSSCRGVMFFVTGTVWTTSRVSSWTPSLSTLHEPTI